MSEYNNPDAEKKIKNDAPTFSWSEVWTMVLTKPSTETFELVLSDPQATRRRAFNWIFITGTIAILAEQIIFAIMPAFARVYGGLNLVWLVCGLALGGLCFVLGFIIVYGLMQFIAKGLGGTGGYSQFFYAAGAFYAPLVMINIALLPFATSGTTVMGLVNLALFIYQMALTGMALRAVNQFGWGKAIATLVLDLIVWVVVFGAMFACILAPLLANYSTYPGLR